MADRVIQRNDTAARWQSINPILATGEIGIEIDGAKGYKIGDGKTRWNDLPYPANPTNVVQELGNNENAVPSQKLVTEKLSELGSELANYTTYLIDSTTLESLAVSSGFINSEGTITTSTAAVHTDFIPINDDNIFIIEGISAESWNVAYYSDDNEESFIESIALINSHTESIRQTFIPKTYAKYIRLTVSVYGGSAYKANLIKSVENYVSEKIEKVKEYVDKEIEKIENSGDRRLVAGIEYLGFLKNPNIFDSDFLYIPMYGQSYTIATDGGYKITDEFDTNVYMHGFANPIGAGGTELQQLSTTQEYVIADIGDIFSRLIKRYTYRSQDIIVGSYGQGSRSIMELSKNNLYGEGYHTYETIFEPGVANAVSSVTSKNKTISCPFVLYLQGESDIASSRSTAATEDSWCKGNKDLYKTYLLRLKKDMQQTIMQATGQTQPPIMIVYTPGNNSFNSRLCGIQEAILESCNENDDIYCVGPYYHMTSMGAHLSPDGRRWQAELFAKQLFDIFIRGEETTMRVKEWNVSGNLVRLSIKTPTPPLVIDTWTYPKQENYGFSLCKVENNVITPIHISKVNVEATSILIEAVDSVENMEGLFITYGATSGGGNVRDSGVWSSFSQYSSNDNGTGNIVYTPLTKNGETLIGKNYPMQAWMPQFGFHLLSKYPSK